MIRARVALTGPDWRSDSRKGVTSVGRVSAGFAGKLIAAGYRIFNARSSDPVAMAQWQTR